jgi:hypothetical protein
VIRKTWIAVAMLTASWTAHAVPVLTENFDDITTLAPAGWSFVNNSSPLGTTGFFQGNPDIFPAQSGAPNSYIGANFNNADFGGTISNWLISPTLSLSNRFTLTFFTRTDLSAIADRLEVRLSLNGDSTDVGSTVDSVGDFTTLLTTINPVLDPAGYPSDWTMFTATFSGIADGTLGRFAFRYNVPDTSINGNYIGIDTVTASVPEPSTLALFGLALSLGFVIVRRKA